MCWLNHPPVLPFVGTYPPQIPLDMWQDLASRSRATARKCDEDALRFRERVSDPVLLRWGGLFPLESSGFVEMVHA